MRLNLWTTLGHIIMLFTCITARGDIANTPFGGPGLEITYSDKQTIDSLITTLDSLTPYQRQRVANSIIPLLKKDLYQTQQQEQQLLSTGQEISYTLFYKKFLLEEQIKHFENYSLCAATTVTRWDSFRCKLKNSYLNTASQFLGWFGYKKKDPTIDQVIDQIMKYIIFERETILFNYDKLLAFLRAKKIMPLPALIDFWDTPELSEKLKKRSKQVSTEVQVQSLGLIEVLAAQALVMAGGQISTQWLAGNDQRFKNIQKKQDAINAAMKEFQAQLKSNHTTTIKSIENAFTDSQKKIGDEYEENNTLLQQELAYLNQSINLDAPLTRYVTYPIEWDKYFETSPMLIPQAPYVWYNLFNKGDWQFDATRNSFWQNSLIPFPKELLWDKKNDKNIFTDDPAANSIFTEYITDKLSYDIEVECTIITCTYPFFVGITFNRGRWISGDPERIWWYRALGLYGTEDNRNKTINLSFAQQQLVPKTATLPEKIISPLEQIIKNKTTPISYQLSAQDVQSLINNPTTYRFKITTRPGTVLYTLEKKELTATNKETITPLYSGTINNLENYMFMFHGLGFIAAGCQAEFKIIKPEQLVFTQEQVTLFNQTLVTILNP